jgi:hypothetical protein
MPVSVVTCVRTQQQQQHTIDALLQLRAAAIACLEHNQADTAGIAFMPLGRSQCQPTASIQEGAPGPPLHTPVQHTAPCCTP